MTDWERAGDAEEEESNCHNRPASNAEPVYELAVKAYQARIPIARTSRASNCFCAAGANLRSPLAIPTGEFRTQFCQSPASDLRVRLPLLPLSS
jgi:hypothetical protein